jgi:hypothetical protein
MKFALVLALAAAAYTPIPKAPVHKAGCVAYQVCQQCSRRDSFGDTVTYQCGCHMECLPGSEGH